MSVLASFRNTGIIDCNTFNEVGVTDGLISYWDATNSGSYKVGSTTWYNLVAGQPNLPMVGAAISNVGVSGSYGWQMDAANKFFFVAVNDNWGLSAADCTIEVIFMMAKTELFPGNDRSTLCEILGNNGIFMSYELASLQTQAYWYGHPTEGYWFGQIALSRQRWHHCVNVWNYNDAHVHMWTDGVKKTSAPGTTQGYAPNTGAGIYVGAENSLGQRQLSGWISVVRIYGRALTDVEVMINFDHFKDQYGIE